MKKIYKYTLKPTSEQTITIPSNSRILSVEEQYSNIVVYALVDTTKEEIEDYYFQIRGTGHDADYLEDYTFLGTVKLHDGQLMFHVFYR